MDANSLLKSPVTQKHHLLDEPFGFDTDEASRKNSVSEISKASRARKGSEIFDADGNPAKPLEIKLFESSLGNVPHEEKPTGAPMLGKRSFEEMDQEES
jgi:hypothetical protein